MAHLEPRERMAELLARTLTDDDFRKRLLADPEGTLRAEGFSLPPEIRVKVVENSADLIHIVLPAKQEALSDEELDKVTAGASRYVGFPGGKKCGNNTCPHEYNSISCWLEWAIDNNCKNKNFTIIGEKGGIKKPR